MSESKLSQEQQKLREEVNKMYTPLSVAKKEIWKRWNDKELRKKVRVFLGNIPYPFRKIPRAVLSRNIITPDIEFFYLQDLVRQVRLKFLGLEGIDDRFATNNPDKASFGKFTFLNDKEAGIKVKNKSKLSNDKFSISVFDINKSNGKEFSKIKTSWGQNLVKFHHSLLTSMNLRIETFDDIKWLEKERGALSPREYYECFFSFFVCHGTLFENFLINKHELEFTVNVVLPSFKKISSLFGIRPMIVPIFPIEDENSFYWRCYPKIIKDIIDAKRH